jgi:hypothetical protein
MRRRSCNYWEESRGILFMIQCSTQYTEKLWSTLNPTSNMMEPKHWCIAILLYASVNVKNWSTVGLGEAPHHF